MSIDGYSSVVLTEEPKETSLIWQAHQMLERWRAWSEKRDALHEEFCALVNDSDDLQDRLLDEELKQTRNIR